MQTSSMYMKNFFVFQEQTFQAIITGDGTSQFVIFNYGELNFDPGEGWPQVKSSFIFLKSRICIPRDLIKN